MHGLIVLHGCATIQLTKGCNTLIDADDWPRLSERRWSVTRFRNGVAYAIHRIRRPSYKEVRMHREIAGHTAGELVDHANRDGLDNRRANLRPANKSLNRINAAKQSRSRSRYKGVTPRPDGGCIARIRKDGQIVFLGRFLSEIEAAAAYNRAAVELFGEFARINEGVGHA